MAVLAKNIPLIELYVYYRWTLSYYLSQALRALILMFLQNRKN